MAFVLADSRGCLILKMWQPARAGERGGLGDREGETKRRFLVSLSDVPSDLIGAAEEGAGSGRVLGGDKKGRGERDDR